MQYQLKHLPIRPPHIAPRNSPTWSLAYCAGNLVECSGSTQGAQLTVAMKLVREAQSLAEPSLWISAHPTSFYPPDVQDFGVDLSALPVVRLKHIKDAMRAADMILRSGAFSLVVVDLYDKGDIPLAMQSRLMGLARRHHTALVCLSRHAPKRQSLGPMVFLKVDTHRQERSEQDGKFSVLIHSVKDKRWGSRWESQEICDGPPGLR